MNNTKMGLIWMVIGLVLGIVCTMNWNSHQMPNGAMMNGMNHENVAIKDKEHSMHSEMEGMMAGLEGKTGDEFDKEFLNEMIVHHEGAVQMAEAALKYAKHQEIKDLSQAIIAAQNKEIAQMKEWAGNWYKAE